MNTISPLHAIASYNKSSNLKSLGEPFDKEAKQINLSSQPSFSDFVKGEVKSAINTIQSHEGVTTDAIRGKADPLAVMTSMIDVQQKVTMATTVVNRAVQVITEITKMTV